LNVAFVCVVYLLKFEQSYVFMVSVFVIALLFLLNFRKCAAVCTTNTVFCTYNMLLLQRHKLVSVTVAISLFHEEHKTVWLQYYTR